MILKLVSIALLALVIGCTTAIVEHGMGSSKRLPGSTLSLDQAAALNGRHFGTAVGTVEFTQDASDENILGREFGVVVPENSMKMASVQQNQGQFTFSSANALVDYAQAHSMLVRGTCLAWNEAVPDWVTKGNFSGEQLENILSTHIATVVGHFRDRNPGIVKYWDVVNEAYDNGTGKISQSIWNAIGNAPDDYIAKSFTWAHAADPNAILFLNDHRIEELNAKSDVVYAKAKAQVTRGGLAIGALAIADDEPEIANQILVEAQQTLATVAVAYAPDGGWGEGLDYWNYATQYFSAYLACIRSATGKESPLSHSPGLAESGYFEIYEVGPLTELKRPGYQDFNFADDKGEDTGNAHLFWLANEFEHPEFADKERLRLLITPWNVNIFHLLWDPGKRPAPPSLEGLPLDHAFRGVNVATFHSSWTDPDALYVGFKGGIGGIAHGHLDQGSFVLDALGERWALDLGAETYAVPGYFNRKTGQRWTYYRTSTAGHNTVTIDGQNQEFQANSPLIAFSERADRRFAIADLRAAYPGQLTEFRRGLAVLPSRRVLIQDDLTGVPTQSHTGTWHFHTPAKVKLFGNRALLVQGGKEMSLTILSPKGTTFSAAPAMATTPPGQSLNAGVTDLTFTFPVTSESTTLRVVIGPPGKTRVLQKYNHPLAKWATQ